MSLPVGRLVVSSIRPGVSLDAIEGSSTAGTLSVETFFQEMAPSERGVWEIGWWQGSTRALQALARKLGADPYTQVVQTPEGSTVTRRFCDVAGSVADVTAEVDAEGLARIRFDLHFAPLDIETRVALLLGRESEGMTYEDSDDSETFWNRERHWVGLAQGNQKWTIRFGRLGEDE